MVEHLHGKEKVAGSIPALGSRIKPQRHFAVRKFRGAERREIFRRQNWLDFGLGVPIKVRFTSDFNQIALLQVFGLDEVQGKLVLEFRPAVGSYVEVEVFADDTAKVYYQPATASVREELGTIANFHEKLKSIS